MTQEEKARLVLHYIDALTRTIAVTRFEEKERAERMSKACHFFESIVII